MVRGVALRFWLLLLCFVMMACEVLPALAMSRPLDSLKVAYIYNIAKFTRWPASTWASPDSPFQFCLYGEGGVVDELQSLAKKEISGHPIILLKPAKEADFSQCNALYISVAERRRYRYLLSLINQKTVLTISDDGLFLRHGGLINLLEKEQRLRFEVNMQQLSRSELKLSSKLLKLAILVDNPR